LAPGFSSNTTNPRYKIAEEKNKLTIEEMNQYDMHLDVAERFAELKRGRQSASL
jgi:salicylate hydroxylase